MKYKIGLIFICLLICLFTIASAVAGDTNETVVANEYQCKDLITAKDNNDIMVASDDQNNELITIEDTDESVTYDNQINKENILVDSKDVYDVSVTEENKLSATPGTFTDLANEINGTYQEFELTRNYYFSSNSDKDFEKGIIINKQIIINGKGFQINGGNLARAFKIEHSNVVLKNIIFTNCKPPLLSTSSVEYSYSTGGAIYWEGENGILDNCTFRNCFTESHTSSYSSSSLSRGGAIFWSANHGTINNCKFINCYSTVYGSYKIFNAFGGAVYIFGNYGKISNSYFEQCKVYSSTMQSDCEGGAIYWKGTNGIIDNSIFYKCSASISGERSYSYGGAISYIGDYGEIKNCNFDSNYADNEGGALILSAIGCTLKNSNFKNNNASNDLNKAVYWKSDNGNIINSNIDQKQKEETKQQSNSSSKYNINNNQKSSTKKIIPTFIVKKQTFNVNIKTKKVFVTLKDKNGPIKNVKLTLKIKGKTFHAKTNSKGVATFKVTKLTKISSYSAVVKFAGNKKYKSISKTVKITVKKATTKKKNNYITFKGKSKYTWKIKDTTWKKMKKNAIKEYEWLHERGSGSPGYSNGVKVTVAKNGHKYTGTAYAVKNDFGIRCEVRGVGNGLYISTLGDYYL